MATDTWRGRAIETAATRGIVSLLIGRACFMATGYAITVMLARGLGPAAYGVYGLIMSLLLWFESASALGMPRAAMTLMPAAERPAVIAATIRSLLLLVTLIIFAVCWVLAPTIAAWFKIPDGTYLFRLAVVDVPLNGLFLAYQGTLQGQRRFAAVSASFAIYGVTKLAAVTSLLVLGFSIQAALIANILATVGALAYLVTRDAPHMRFAGRELIGAIASVALPWAMVTASLELLFAAHLWILNLSLLVPEDLIGHYVAALALARLPTVVAAIVAGVLLTNLAAAIAYDDRGLAERHLRHAIRIAALLLLPVASVGAVHATEIMTLVYSSAYSDGGAYLRVLLSAFCVYALLAIALHALMAAGALRSVAGLLAGSLGGGLLLDVVLTSRVGASGAAYAFLATILAATAVAALMVRRRLRLSIPVASIARTLGCTLLVTAVGTLIPSSGVGLLVELAVLGILYVAALLTLGELKQEYASLMGRVRRGRIAKT